MGGAQASSTEALPFDVIDLTPTTVVAFRPPVSVDRPSTTSSRPDVTAWTTTSAASSAAGTKSTTRVIQGCCTQAAGTDSPASFSR